MEQTKATALERRREIQTRARDMGLDEQAIARFVMVFYARVQAHPALGPVFANNVGSWPAHLQMMQTFWRSVLLNTGEYSGKPVQAHLTVAGIAACQFPIWMRLFEDALTETGLGPEPISHVMTRARRIAASLLRGLEEGGTT